MKVIFLQDVPDVARAGEVKEVADGYGRNFLIPNKLAMMATPGALRQFEAQRHVFEEQRNRLQADLTEIGDRLAGLEVVLRAKAGAGGRLYGSITSADIAQEILNVTGHTIDKRNVRLKQPIRELGKYDVTIRLSKEVTPSIKVAVVAEEVQP